MLLLADLGFWVSFTQLQIHVLRVATTSEFETHGTDFVEEKFMRLSYEWGRRFTNESLVN
jgi:hypothetical protein